MALIIIHMPQHMVHLNADLAFRYHVCHNHIWKSNKTTHGHIMQHMAIRILERMLSSCSQSSPLSSMVPSSSGYPDWTLLCAPFQSFLQGGYWATGTTGKFRNCHLLVLNRGLVSLHSRQPTPLWDLEKACKHWRHNQLRPIVQIF